MTRKIVRSILFSATLLVSLAAVATAQDDRICSTPVLAGEWGYTSTGAFIFSTGAVPFALVGRLTDAAGNFSGAQNSSTGGQVLQKTIKGTTTVNPDCTGTHNVNVYNQSGTLLSTSVLAFVIVDNGREVGGIFTSQTLANGTNGPTVATFNAKRQFARAGQ
jgi:hypothetical protein